MITEYIMIIKECDYFVTNNSKYDFIAVKRTNA